MNTPTAVTAGAPPPRFDEKFIEDHRLIERYLDNKLPVKGARDLENWCRANPAYVDALKLSERAQSSLRLLEACARPLDLAEPPEPWWRSVYVPIGTGTLALAGLIALWALFGKYHVLQGELRDSQARLQQGSLVQPSAAHALTISPDHAPGIGQAKISVATSAPQLVDLHIDMSYVKPLQFRLVVDKRAQGRALVLENLLKDSNGELRATFNTSGLAAGIYDIRIESMLPRGGTMPAGWLLLDVH